MKELQQWQLEQVKIAKTKLLEQGCISQGEIEEGIGCMYRGPDGNKCGIGHLFPDEIYHKSLEGASVSQLDGRNPHQKKLKNHLRIKEGKTQDLMAEIQGIHDCSRVEDWEEDFNILEREVSEEKYL